MGSMLSADFNGWQDRQIVAVNLAKAICEKLRIPYSISSCRPVIYNTYMLERFICVSEVNSNTQVFDKLFKELFLFTAKSA